MNIIKNDKRRKWVEFNVTKEEQNKVYNRFTKQVFVDTKPIDKRLAKFFYYFMWNAAYLLTTDLYPREIFDVVSEILKDENP